MKCPFCGAEFDEARVKCASCPLHATCKATCCPNCGYELSRESKLVDGIQRIVNQLNKRLKLVDNRKIQD